MTAEKPIFEFKPFERPERSIGAIAGFVAMSGMISSGQHILVAYTLYLVAITLPRALVFEAKKFSYVGKKGGFIGLLIPWAYLPFPKLPKVSDLTRLGLAAVNWLIVLPALAFAVAFVSNALWG